MSFCGLTKDIAPKIRRMCFCPSKQCSVEPFMCLDRNVIVEVLTKAGLYAGRSGMGIEVGEEILKQLSGERLC